MNSSLFKCVFIHPLTCDQLSYAIAWPNYPQVWVRTSSKVFILSQILSCENVLVYSLAAIQAPVPRRRRKTLSEDKQPYQTYPRQCLSHTKPMASHNTSRRRARLWAANHHYSWDLRCPSLLLLYIFYQ